ncbi:uncharacterized protein [Heliangelus exortis]|uniref:uncharacterized protein n=1 Tax=Heliangelus exortis TaxID=472823 RepID=UPI003A9188B1
MQKSLSVASNESNGVKSSACWISAKRYGGGREGRGGGEARRCRASAAAAAATAAAASAAQRRAGADCGNPEVVVAITGRVLHNALGGSNSDTGAGGGRGGVCVCLCVRVSLCLYATPAPASRRAPAPRGGRTTPPLTPSVLSPPCLCVPPSTTPGAGGSPGPFVSAPRPRSAPGPRRPPLVAPHLSIMSSPPHTPLPLRSSPSLLSGSPRDRRPSELTRPPAAAAAPPPTNHRRAAPSRAPIGPGGKRGSGRQREREADRPFIPAGEIKTSQEAIDAFPLQGGKEKRKKN